MKKKAIIFFFGLLLIFCTICGVFAEDFTKNTMYLIMTDRFFDGDKTNNFDNELFSKDQKEWKLYWGGDFQGIIDKIPYLKEMGINAIWITPVVENPECLYKYGDEKMAGYHGYWAKDFKKINPHFGTMDKFKELINKCHQNNIKVILDIVLNHTSPVGRGVDGALCYDGKFFSDYSNDKGGYFHHDGSIDFGKEKERDLGNYYYKNLFDLADLSQDNPDVYKILNDAYLFWMDQGIDGFRVDTVKLISPYYFKNFVTSMKQKRDIFIFGEWYEAGPGNDLACFYEKTADIPLIDFSLSFAIKDIFIDNKSFTLLEDLYKIGHNFKYVNEKVNFLDSHDLPRAMTAMAQKHGEGAARVRTTLALYTMMLSPGIPCIYYGTEQFMHTDTASIWGGAGSDPYNRDMMKSFQINDFCKNIKKISDLREKNPALSIGGIKVLKADNDVFVFERNYKNNTILFAVNKGNKRKIELTNLKLKDGIYSKANPKLQTILGKDIKIKNGNAVLELDKYEFGLYAN